MTAGPLLHSTRQGRSLVVEAGGTWTAARAAELEKLVEAVAAEPADVDAVEIRVAGIARLDTYGAWLIERLRRTFGRGKVEAQVIGLDPRFDALIGSMHESNRHMPPAPPQRNRILAFIEGTGRVVVGMGRDFVEMTAFLGEAAAAAGAGAAPAGAVPADRHRPPDRPRRPRRGADHRADHLPDRRHRRPAGRVPFPQVRRRDLCRRHDRHSCAARAGGASGCDHARRPLRLGLHRRARLDEDARRDRRDAGDGARSGRGAGAAAADRAGRRHAAAHLHRRHVGAHRRRAGHLALWRHEPGDLSRPAARGDQPCRPSRSA